MPRTKLTPVLHAEIIKNLTACAPIAKAADAAGISKQQFYEWRRRGDRALATLDVDGSVAEAIATLPDDERPFARFAHDVRETLGKLAVGLGGRLLQATRRDWRATAWLLERKFPEDFGTGTDARARQRAMAELLDRLEQKLSGETYREVLLAMVDDPGAEDDDASDEDAEAARH